MKIISGNKNQATLELNADEILLITNALGEIIAGPYQIEDWEFHPLIGVEKSQATTLQEEFGKLLENN